MSAHQSVRLRKYQPGDKIGRWEVVEYLQGTSLIRVRCECGTQADVSRGSLFCGKSKQCGSCYRAARDLGAEHRIFSRLCYGAASRGYEVKVTPEYVFNLLKEQDYRCALSGVPITVADTSTAHGKGRTSASLDRIDSTKGYIEGNLQWVHKTLNRMKMATPDSEFRKWCCLVADHTRGNNGD